MAEILGVVASGISVAQIAGQVASSIIKLKDYWNQISDAPTDINRLLREIESLNFILCHVQDDWASFEHGKSNLGIQKSLELCIEGADELCALVNRLREKVEVNRGWKRKLGAVKVVLKKEEIKEMKRRMKSAISLLSLSYQCHTSAMIQVQPELIVARVSSHVTRLIINNGQPQDSSLASHPESSTTRSTNLVATQYNTWTTSSSWMRYLLGSYEYWKQNRQHKGKEREEFSAKLTVPFWPERMWDCRGYETLSGWRVNLQTYRILPINSPFFNAVEEGDIDTVRAILANRQASVTDRAYSSAPYSLPGINIRDTGDTALHIAASCGNLEMCRLLLLEGADPMSYDGQNRTPLHRAAIRAAYNTFKLRQNQSWETARLLISKGASDALIDDVTVIKDFHGPRSMFNFLQQHMYPPYRELSPQTRFDVAAQKTLSGWHNAPAILGTLLRVEGDFDRRLTTLTDSQGQTLLHRLVINFVETTVAVKHVDEDLDDSLSAEELGYLTPTRTTRLAWKSLIGKVAAAGADLNASDALGRTPLCTLIHMCPVFLRMSPPDLVKFWLEELFAVGIDLLEYGAVENVALQKLRDHEYNEGKCVLYRPHWPAHTHINECSYRTRMINFQYGTRPADWIFWLSEPTDQFAGDFWSLIEDQIKLEEEQFPTALSMPGSWNNAEDTIFDKE